MRKAVCGLVAVLMVVMAVMAADAARLEAKVARWRS